MDNEKLLTLDMDINIGLGQFLIQDKLITPAILNDAKLYCHSHQMTLTYYLVKSSMLNGLQILNCCKKYFELPIYYLNVLDQSMLKAPVLPLEWIRRFRIMPLQTNGGSLQLGVTDPTCFSIISKVRFHTGLQVNLYLINEETLELLLLSMISTEKTPSLESLVSAMMPLIAAETTAQLDRSEEDDEPVTQLVNQLLSDGDTYRASDIHCEPYHDHYRIRFRIDGQLQDRLTVPSKLASRMIARIKLLSHLDVAEKRLPQDGRMNVQLNPPLELRVSTCPTVMGEKIVLRLFRQHHGVMTLDQLGLLDEQLAVVQFSIKKPYGLIIVTGPTGSGKTATLYAMIQTLKDEAVNIVTIEEPVEIMVPGVNQINIHSRIGLTFNTVLRAILRQDPDVILIGEIRDAETAIIAIQAASTGHLVLGTLHANHTLAAIHRLNLLGVNLTDSLQSIVMVMTQRLVRQLCVHCKAHDMNFIAADFDVSEKHAHRIYLAKGCTHCQEGYYGRAAVFEVLTPDERLVSLFHQHIPLNDILTMLKKTGWLSLYKVALQKVLLGETSMAEVQRVIGYA